MKKFLQMVFHRVVFVGAALGIQAAALIIIITRFTNYFVHFYAASVLLSLAMVLVIINGRSRSGYKIAWILLILLFPIFGGIFYLLFGGSRLSRRLRRKMNNITAKMAVALVAHGSTLQQIQQQDAAAGGQARYIQEYAYCPPYFNSKVGYFPSGETKFAALVKALQAAEHYIFLEYFIISEGIMWNTILDILVEKAQSGVDVRLIYDDLGCIFTLPYRYDRKLERMGIQCCVFNPFVPILRSRLNNRDHRKIAVIDGHTGFTGGINLADEYINAKPKYGHWKDSAVMIQGEAVWSLTVMFLALWGYLRDIDEDVYQFRPDRHRKSWPISDGVVQPFTDNPLDDEPVGETVYMNLINKAEKYVYITTPYLILDAEMITSLCNAAKSGIDVRVITPHIPDKWYVHAVTRAYYAGMLESGVRIYEYSPGFMHSKTFVVDDTYAVVGTINLDYRSLYLHFECGVWLYNSHCVMQVKQDFIDTLQSCQEVYLPQLLMLPWHRKLGRNLLRVFAPLM